MRADEYTNAREAWPTPRTLVGADYYAPEVFELERERIFHGGWYCVGREEDIASGGFVVVDVVGESVVLVRDREGVLRAFFNACRHRGARLCDGSGSAGRTLVCPYHAWSYRLDGALAGTPNVADDESFSGPSSTHASRTVCRDQILGPRSARTFRIRMDWHLQLERDQ